MAETDNKSQEQTASGGSLAGNTTPQPRPCPKDCNQCGFQQHAFCAAKMSFDTFTVLSQMMQTINTQKEQIKELSQRIGSLQSGESVLSTPEHIQGDLFAATE